MHHHPLPRQPADDTREEFEKTIVARIASEEQTHLRLLGELMEKTLDSQQSEPA